MTALHVVKALRMKCERCGYKCLRDKAPKRCPKCKSPYWHVKAGVLKRGRPKAEGK